MADYPEHEKLKTIQHQSQTCGVFLEWLGEQGYSLCVCVDKSKPEFKDTDRYDGEFVPLYTDTQQLLAQHFEIDLAKIEREKEQMLEEFSSSVEETLDDLVPEV